MSDWEEVPDNQPMQISSEWEELPHEDNFSSNQNVTLSSPFNISYDNFDKSLSDITPLPQNREEWLRNLAQSGGALGMIAQPEFAAGRGLIPYILNALGRVGQGAASATAFQSPELKNPEDFKNALQRNALLSGILEGGALPFHAISGFSELSNPLNYAKDKISQIRNEYVNAKEAQKAAYDPVMQQYGQNRVAADQVNFLKDLGINRKGLYTDAKDLYDEFIKDPNLQNLHNLQSQIGRDYGRIASNSDKVNTAQRFFKYQNASKNAIKDFLAKDQNALNSYERGDEITRNIVKPYESNPTIEKVALGKIKSLPPESLANEIEKGTQKKFGEIPIGHPLINHLNDLNSKINVGKAWQIGLPASIGALGGGWLHPALGVAGAGSGAALGKFVGPSVTEFAQNPSVQGLFRNFINPLYRGYGRTGVSLYNENR